MKKRLLLLVLSVVFLLVINTANQASADVQALEANPISAGDMDSKSISGTYTGTAAGNNGDVTVEVTLEEGIIISVTVMDQQETESIASNALKLIPEYIVASQSLEADAV